MPLGQRFDRRKGIEAILYVASRVNDPTFHRVSRILYFADKYHLAHYGALICGDDYLAMKHGPVPSGIYDILKAVHGDGDFGTGKEAANALTVESGKRVRPLRDPNLNELSESDREALDSAIAEYGQLSFSELTKLSRDSAWDAADENEFMDIVEIARSTPNSEQLVAHIRDPFPQQD
jgi:uncharacterized phage-associated protein